MSQAVRAIIIQDEKLLVMQRDKYGSKYFTLVGGGIDEGETPEQALLREVKEETGLSVTAQILVFKEELATPYATQYIYLCDIVPGDKVAIGEATEEDKLNKLGVNIHAPMWVSKSAFSTLAFRTPQLQKAIID